MSMEDDDVDHPSVRTSAGFNQPYATRPVEITIHYFVAAAKQSSKE